MPQTRFHIAAKKVTNSIGENTLELYFLDAIENPTYYDWDSGEMEEGNLVAQVVSYVNGYNPGNILCHIDTYGGDLNIALAIYNFLKNCSAKVECRILNMCMSAGTIIACSASKGKLLMPRNGFWVMHKPKVNVDGNGEELRQAADVADAYDTQIADIYAQRNTTGKTAADIQAMWATGDCWLSGLKAKELGFVDDTYNDNPQAVSAKIKAYAVTNSIPKDIVIEDESEAAPGFFTKMFNEFKEFKMEIKNLITGFKADAAIVKVENAGTINFAEVLEPSVSNLLAKIEEQVTAEIGTVTNTVTTSVTNAMEEKYGATIAALTKQLDELQADVTNKLGVQSSGAPDKQDPPAKPGFRMTVN